MRSASGFQWDGRASPAWANPDLPWVRREPYSASVRSNQNRSALGPELPSQPDRERADPTRPRPLVLVRLIERGSSNQSSSTTTPRCPYHIRARAARLGPFRLPRITPWNFWSSGKTAASMRRGRDYPSRCSTPCRANDVSTHVSRDPLNSSAAWFAMATSFWNLLAPPVEDGDINLFPNRRRTARFSRGPVSPPSPLPLSEISFWFCLSLYDPLPA